MASYKVELYLYDLSQGLAKNIISPLLNGKQADGIWHTGVVVYGREYFFGSSGVQFVLPGGTILGHTYKVIYMEQTQIPQDVFEDYLRELAENKYRAETYHLLDHNCNTFSDEVCAFLINKNIPSFITDLPKDVKNSPIGSFLKPLIDEIYKSGNQITPSSSTASNLYHSESTSADSLNNSASLFGAMFEEFLKQSLQEQQLNTQQEQQLNTQQEQQLNTQQGQQKNNLQQQQDAPSCIVSKCIHVVDDKKLTEKLGECRESEKNVYDEILEYVGRDTTWSISRIHINFLCNKVLRCKSGGGLDDNGSMTACRLLQSCLLKKDTLPVIFNDPSKNFINLLRCFSIDNLIGLHNILVRCVCNLLSYEEVTEEYFIKKRSERDVIVEFVISCAMFSDVDVNKTVCQSICNLFLYWSKEVCPEICLKLGVAIFEIIKRGKLSDSIHLWFAFYQCLKESQELTMLASAMYLEEGLANSLENDFDVGNVGEIKKLIKNLLQ